MPLEVRRCLVDHLDRTAECHLPVSSALLPQVFFASTFTQNRLFLFLFSPRMTTYKFFSVSAMVCAVFIHPFYEALFIFYIGVHWGTSSINQDIFCLNKQRSEFRQRACGCRSDASLLKIGTLILLFEDTFEFTPSTDSRCIGTCFFADTSGTLLDLIWYF